MVAEGPAQEVRPASIDGSAAEDRPALEAGPAPRDGPAPGDVPDPGDVPALGAEPGPRDRSAPKDRSAAEDSTTSEDESTSGDEYVRLKDEVEQFFDEGAADESMSSSAPLKPKKLGQKQTKSNAGISTRPPQMPFH